MSNGFGKAVQVALTIAIVVLIGRLGTQLVLDRPIEVGLEVVTFLLFVVVLTALRWKTKLLG